MKLTSNNGLYQLNTKGLYRDALTYKTGNTVMEVLASNHAFVLYIKTAVIMARMLSNQWIFALTMYDIPVEIMIVLLVYFLYIFTICNMYAVCMCICCIALYTCRFHMVSRDVMYLLKSRKKWQHT